MTGEVGVGAAAGVGVGHTVPCQTGGFLICSRGNIVYHIIDRRSLIMSRSSSRTYSEVSDRWLFHSEVSDRWLFHREGGDIGLQNLLVPNVLYTLA